MFTRLLVVASATVLGLSGAVFHEPRSTRMSASSVAEPAASPHRSEAEWIVADIVGAIAGMAEYARTGKTAAAGTVTASLETPLPTADSTQPAAFSIRHPAHQARLRVTLAHGIWRSVDYAPLASSLFGDASGPAQSNVAPVDVAMLSALTRPRAEVMLSENARISKRLAGDMRSYRAHEQAALLLGVLALREGAGLFDDVRSTLSRMTAHLACAEALRGAAPQSAEGFLAETIVLHLSGYQSAARIGLDSVSLAGAPEPLRVWVRALMLRVTGDWRAIFNPRDATLLERLEYARAVRDRLGAGRLLAFLAQAGDDPISDWQHIVLEEAFGVEAGNRFTGDPRSLELREAQEVWAAFHDSELGGWEAAGHLNDEPWPSPVGAVDGEAVVRVIDWGRWAGFLQRHLCQQIAAEARHDWNLGASTAAKAETLRAAGERFGLLRLYPIVLRTAAVDEADYRRAMDAAAVLVREHPEQIPAVAWYRLDEKPDTWAKKPMASAATWFTLHVLPGTIFDQDHRTLRPNHTAPLAWLERWKSHRPYDAWLLMGLAYSRAEAEARSKGLADDRPSFESAVRILGPLMDYDLSANNRVATYLSLTPPQSVAVTTRMCDANVDRCQALANTLLRAGREAEAEQVYERWVEGAVDRVAVSGGLTWLVRYYADTDRLDRAMELAAMAAATGSAIGLETLAHLLDRQGSYEQAEEIYERIADRYENSDGYLGAFYRRMARRSGDAAYEARAASALTDDFKQGIESVSVEAQTTAPVDGITFGRFGARASRIGVRADDVIVGVDGIRIHNTWEYQLAARFAEPAAAPMELLVWRDGRYQALKLEVPQRWFGADFRNYVVPKTSKTTGSRASRE